MTVLELLDRSVALMAQNSSSDVLPSEKCWNVLRLLIVMRAKKHSCVLAAAVKSGQSHCGGIQVECVQVYSNSRFAPDPHCEAIILLTAVVR
jgi:hypothetical protein